MVGIFLALVNPVAKSQIAEPHLFNLNQTTEKKSYRGARELEEMRLHNTSPRDSARVLKHQSKANTKQELRVPSDRQEDSAPLH
jgi:hypothetical protein